MAIAEHYSRMKIDPQRVKQAAKLLLFLLVLVSLNQVVDWLAGLFQFQFWPHHLDMATLIFCLSSLLYILLLATPFLPGVEIGLILMSLLGLPGILVIYLCTLLALSLSFMLGRILSPMTMARVLDWFHLERARNLVEKLAPLDAAERSRFLLENAPSKLVPLLLRHRYLVFTVLLNMPGNALVGGGGGIGLIAGMSRLFPFPRFLLLIALAILPGPIFFLLRGS